MSVLDREFQKDDFQFAHDVNEKLIDQTYKATSYAKDVWANFKKNKCALVGAVIIAIIILFALIGPGLNAHTYKSIEHGHECLTPRLPGIEKIGLFDGSYTLSGFIQAVSQGIINMEDLAIVAILIGGMIGIIQHNGGIQWLLNFVSSKIKSKKSKYT